MDQNRKDAVSSYLGRGQPTGLLLSGGIGFSGPVAKRAEPSQYAPATLSRVEGAPSNKLINGFPPAFVRDTVGCSLFSRRRLVVSLRHPTRTRTEARAEWRWTAPLQANQGIEMGPGTMR